MTDLRSAQPLSVEDDVAPRRAYEPPRLTEFGSVKELTRAGSGGKGELGFAKKRS